MWNKASLLNNDGPRSDVSKATEIFDRVQRLLLPRLRIWLQSDLSYQDRDEMQRVVSAARDAGLLG